LSDGIALAYYSSEDYIHFFLQRFCAGAAMLCQQEKNYIRGGGWRLVGCGFFGVLQIGSAMQQSFSALALALSRADIFV